MEGIISNYTQNTNAEFVSPLHSGRFKVTSTYEGLDPDSAGFEWGKNLF